MAARLIRGPIGHVVGVLVRTVIAAAVPPLLCGRAHACVLPPVLRLAAVLPARLSAPPAVGVGAPWVHRTSVSGLGIRIVRVLDVAPLLSGRVRARLVRRVRAPLPTYPDIAPRVSFRNSLASSHRARGTPKVESAVSRR